MFHHRLSFIVLSMFALGACAIHPLPEDFEGFDTVQIVERIRCEAAKSVQDEAKTLLRAEHNDLLADDLEAHPWKFYTITEHDLRNQTEKNFYNRYINTAIAYSFTLDITEDNMSSANIDLLKMVTNGSVGLNLTASNDHSRQNTRAFVITENFGHLIHDKKLCMPSPAVPDPSNHDLANFVYPITGSIGLYKFMGTFIELNRDGILSNEEKDKDKAPVMTDTLVFTTELVGSASPQVMLSPVGHNVGVPMASLVGKATRRDMNQVIVSLSLEPKQPLDQNSRNRAAARFSTPLSPGSNGAAVFARRDLMPAEERAVDAISQQKIDNFYNKFDQFFSR